MLLGGNEFYMEADYGLRLIGSLTEEVKLPLLQIACLAASRGRPDKRLNHISTIADTALQLTDGWLLGLGKTSLDVEPLALAPVLDEVAQTLAPYAQLEGCRVELDVSSRLRPALAEKQHLKMALTLLAYGLLRGHASGRRLVLSAYNKRGRWPAVGVLAAGDRPVAESLVRCRRLLERGTPVPAPSNVGSFASLYLANDLLTHQGGGPLQAVKRRGLGGLVCRLTPSQQLGFSGV